MILIYKVDYKFLTGVVWREAIQHAQQLEKINQGQYGVCPGRNCTSVNHVLGRIKKGYFNNDSNGLGKF